MTENLYERLRRTQRKGKSRDNELMDLLNDLVKYVEWQRYVTGRRNHKWDENLQPMNRDRNGYTDHEMMQDFKKLQFDDDCSPVQPALIAEVKSAHEECQIRQFEVDELEIYLQHKLGELEKAHELFRVRMCEIKRLTGRAHGRSTVRTRPVTFPAHDSPQTTDNKDSPPRTSHRASNDFRISSFVCVDEQENRSRQMTAPPIPKDILELSQEKFGKGRPSRLKKRWNSFKKSFRRNNN
ncbi:uncharacterized protein LOC105447526 [Strongylocentrotus purpuratus]|uniref:Uncharacterized protein n=1 Tax=Strongylocentrotus purpuratus TaxID=7668 RepID=A0A7M7PNQ7_STRPU|nr:uncharacterized protein LOC105447526 [Strongylocentrotus purpuratus]